MAFSLHCTSLRKSSSLTNTRKKQSSKSRYDGLRTVKASPNLETHQDWREPKSEVELDCKLPVELLLSYLSALFTPVFVVFIYNISQVSPENKRKWDYLKVFYNILNCLVLHTVIYRVRLFYKAIEISQTINNLLNAKKVPI